MAVSTRERLAKFEADESAYAALLQNLLKYGEAVWVKNAIGEQHIVPVSKIRSAGAWVTHCNYALTMRAAEAMKAPLIGDIDDDVLAEDAAAWGVTVADENEFSSWDGTARSWWIEDWMMWPVEVIMSNDG